MSAKATTRSSYAFLDEWINDLNLTADDGRIRICGLHSDLGDIPGY